MIHSHLQNLQLPAVHCNSICSCFNQNNSKPTLCWLCLQMLGIWCVVLWQQLGCPSKLQLLELGPGRGTLMADLLRGTAAFKPFADALQVSGPAWEHTGMGSPQAGIYGVLRLYCCGSPKVFTGVGSQVEIQA